MRTHGQHADGCFGREWGMVQMAALVYLALTLFVIAFQLALVCGAPWGEFTMGGRWRGVLPWRARWIALFSVAVLLFFALCVASRAALVFAQFQHSFQSGVWIVVLYALVACLANAITPSRKEQAVWLPFSAFMLVSSFVVAIGS